MSEDVFKESVFQYLDDLRESGEINMFGATPYLMDDFDLDEQEAKAILIEWMRTFSEWSGTTTDGN